MMLLIKRARNMRITRRRLILSATLLMTSALIALRVIWPETPISRVNAARIPSGLSRDDVEALLGGPARDDSTDVLIPDYHDPVVIPNTRIPPWAPLEWRSDEVIIRVTFDLDDHVLKSTSWNVRRVSRGPLET